jgi:conjugal transfer mating pair stabilization protein TraG
MANSQPAHTKGRAKLYLLPQMSGNGYVSYSPTDSQFGTMQTLEAMMKVAADYFSVTGVELQIGDMSFEHGEPMPPHVTHTDGRCVDLRPFRKDKRKLPVNIHETSYDRDATTLLVKTLRANKNVRKILFNDKKIAGTHWFKGHDNHLHVTFHH